MLLSLLLCLVSPDTFTHAQKTTCGSYENTSFQDNKKNTKYFLLGFQNKRQNLNS